MERIQGQDLFEIMAKEPIHASEAREILRQILEALQVMHGMGRIHKDLKLENVVVNLDQLSPVRRRYCSKGFVFKQRQISTCSSTTTSTMALDLSPTSIGSAKIIDFDTVSDW